MKNKKIHIGFFIPSVRGGGAEKMFVHLANEFTKRDFKVDLLLAQKEGPYLEDISDKVKIVDLRSPRVLKSLFPLIQYLKNEKPDILVSTLNHVNIIAIIAKIVSRVPVKIIIRQAIHYRFFSNKKRLLLDQYLFKKADKIIAISKGVETSLIELVKIPREKVVTITNPVFNQSIIEKSREEILHPFIHKKKYRIILGAGRLSRQKGFLTLIRAFEKMKNDSIRLIILGEGESREELENMVKELGLEKVISMPGFVQNPYAYMARADVFVLSSSMEGFGNVIVEAMACGTNVVSTDCPSGPSEILDGGKYGRLVPVGHIEKLSEAILDTLQNPLSEEILVNRAKLYSVENSADQYQKVFSTLLKR